MVNYITTNTFPIVLDLSCPCLFSCACKRPQREQLQQHLELLELRLGPFKCWRVYRKAREVCKEFHKFISQKRNTTVRVLLKQSSLGGRSDEAPERFQCPNQTSSDTDFLKHLMGNMPTCPPPQGPAARKKGFPR